jgi:hypothetical protein
MSRIIVRVMLQALFVETGGYKVIMNVKTAISPPFYLLLIFFCCNVSLGFFCMSTEGRSKAILLFINSTNSFVSYVNMGNYVYSY